MQTQNLYKYILKYVYLLSLQNPSAEALWPDQGYVSSNLQVQQTQVTVTRNEESGTDSASAWKGHWSQTSQRSQWGVWARSSRACLKDSASVQSTCQELDNWLRSVDRSAFPGKPRTGSSRWTWRNSRHYPSSCQYHSEARYPPSLTKNSVIMELSGPWEDCMEETHERKSPSMINWSSIVTRGGWKARCIPRSRLQRCHWALTSQSAITPQVGITGIARSKSIRNATKAAEVALEQVRRSMGTTECHLNTWSRVSDVERPETPNDPHVTSLMMGWGALGRIWRIW